MKRLLTILFIGFTISIFGQKNKPPRKDYLVNIETRFGTIKAVLYHQTPLHRANFIKLTEKKFYDSLLFHRVIKNFMIQGGDPNSKKRGATSLGGGDVGYKIPAEFVPEFFHKKGVLAAARDNNPERASSGCQFYITQGRVFNDNEFEIQAKRAGRPITDAQKQVYKTLGGTPHLDGAYTVFGEVISGLAFVDSIAAVPTLPGDRPKQDEMMKISLEKIKTKKIKKLYGYQYPNLAYPKL